MARLETVDFQPHRAVVAYGAVTWSPINSARIIHGLPQIFWDCGEPWREANLWLLERLSTKEVKHRTVQASAAALLPYATWLERTGLSWFHFPARKSEQCLVRYRGDIIEMRDNGDLAPSSTSERMRTVVQFYRWLKAARLISTDRPMWTDRTVGIQVPNLHGFERTVSVKTTNLNIANRRSIGDRLEGGLLPVSSVDRDTILSFCREHGSEELFLMLTLGFFTGMRVGTLCDLKIRTLENAVPDPAASNLCRIAVGPGADPPVATKFDVTGQIWICRAHIDELLNYAHSIRRLRREAVSNDDALRDHLFLTRFGTTYSQKGADRSSSLNVAMHQLRKIAALRGVGALRSFRFHQTRCTFATELARLAIVAGGALHAIAIVREALLHRDEATSLRYIKFVEKTPIKQAAANEFTDSFLGLVASRTFD